MKLSEINFRDPFIVTLPDENEYLLFGTEGETVWEGNPKGFFAYQSSDLVNWDGPVQVFSPPSRFWSDRNFWAPEVHRYRGKWYLLATFKAEDRCRGTQILSSDNPLGPYEPHSDGPVTPWTWECLDGTLFVDDSHQPWMVFCHEWGQAGDGKIAAIPLSQDLRAPSGEPVILFAASQSPLASGLLDDGKNGFVTDGPFLWRCQGGELLMLWSTIGDGYTYLQCQAVSRKGSLTGPWEQDPEPLFGRDGGHGILFETIDDRLAMTLHTPNDTPNERPIIHLVEEKEGRIRLLDRI